MDHRHTDHLLASSLLMYIVAIVLPQVLANIKYVPDCVGLKTGIQCHAICLTCHSSNGCVLLTLQQSAEAAQHLRSFGDQGSVTQSVRVPGDGLISCTVLQRAVHMLRLPKTQAPLQHQCISHDQPGLNVSKNRPRTYKPCLYLIPEHPWL